MVHTGKILVLISALCRLLTLIALFKILQCECYPHKRDLNSMPQVLNILSDGLREEVKQTSLLTNITATYSSESSFPTIISLLESQTEHLGNIAVALQKLSQSVPFTAGDCTDVASHGPYRSGAYTVTPWDEQGPFKVYCQMATEGDWMVIQRRIDGSVDFDRGWEDFKNGFGDIDGEMWLGLDKLYRLTSLEDRTWLLRVELTAFDESTAYAEFDNFVIGDESSHFALKSIGEYQGTAGDALTYHLNKGFTTKDRDNDSHSSNCAITNGGGWWHGDCQLSTLNGPYLTSAVNTWNAIVWNQWKSNEALKAVEMKMKVVR